MKKQFSRLLAIALLLGSHFLTAQTTVKLSPNADTYISSFSKTTNLGNRNFMEASAWTQDAQTGNYTVYYERMIISFNLSSIPVCSTVTSAIITFTVDDASIAPINAANPIALYPMTTNWNEASTWSTINNGNGTGFNPNDLGSVQIVGNTNANGSTFNVDVTKLVNEILNGSLANNGFMLKLQNEYINPNINNAPPLADYQVQGVATRENTTPGWSPVLTLTYNSPPVNPIFSTSPATNICAGTSINYSVNPVANANSYKWVINGILVNSSSSPTFTYTWPSTSSGLQTVSVTALNSCTTSGALVSTVTITGLPTSPPSAITGPTSFCKNTTNVYYSNPASTSNDYQWSLNGTPLSSTFNSSYLPLTISSSGTYTISSVFISSNGLCKGTSTNLIITSNGSPLNYFITTAGTHFCPDASYLFSIVTTGGGISGDPTVSYSWALPNTLANEQLNNNQQDDISFPYTPGTTYTIIGYVYGQCGTTKLTTTATMASPVPTPPTVVCGQPSCTSLTISNLNSTYLPSVIWAFNGIVTATGVQSVPYNPSDGNVTVSVTGNNCTYTGGYGTCSNSTTAGSGLRLANEIPLPANNNYLIYPNPSSGAVTIETQGQVGKAYAYNTFGQLAAEVDLTANNYIYNLNLSTKGLYTFKILTNGEAKGYKLIVE